MMPAGGVLRGQRPTGGVLRTARLGERNRSSPPGKGLAILNKGPAQQAKV